MNKDVIQPVTVNQLTKYIRRKFQADPYIYQTNFWLVGELTDYRPSSRHQYFSLKDDNEELPAHEQYKISAVMFANDFRKVKFTPENGMKVLVYGHVDIYPNRGSYQFYVSQMEVQGVGALQIAFQQMYEKLKKEGLFDQPKKAIRPFPNRVAIVTSNDAAVKHDIITTFRRRNPIIQLVFYPTKVQGDEAAAMIAQQIRRVSVDGKYDTLIVARGGGSRGDLWAFNSEEVGRAIAACSIPVISSVGHEVDTTIADLVADDREATPTSAAVRASEWLLSDVKLTIQKNRQQLVHSLKISNGFLQDKLTTLLNNYVFQEPSRILNQPTERLDDLKQQLLMSVHQRQRVIQQSLRLLEMHLNNSSPVDRLKQDRERLMGLQRILQTVGNRQLHQSNSALTNLFNQLTALNPEKVLARGYSYVMKENHVIKQAHQLRVNDLVTIHLADGEVEAEVKQVKNKGVSQNGNN
ncbi:exodeoxyribonuclease VII large subunit [uncultured Limosilactobacillus sp.]|uniref:exodeoxyribonuclease VII large subunit n=1 Tax=uncultured Limosilactobacillus sp. TaxID=2837629 RepID=UPI0025F00D01|nr:exodeoxyribonuclease VII large subunit [uncultured Limosilactobacillus sp.]